MGLVRIAYRDLRNEGSEVLMEGWSDSQLGRMINRLQLFFSYVPRLFGLDVYTDSFFVYFYIELNGYFDQL